MNTVPYKCIASAELVLESEGGRETSGQRGHSSEEA